MLKTLPAELGRTAVALQTRLNSSRLPRKCLLPLGDYNVTEEALRRLRTLRVDNYLILTDEESYQAIAPIGETYGFTTIAGHPDDVLDRYARAVEAYKLDTVIRATGDNPWVFTDCIPGLASRFILHKADYAAYTDLPYGAGVELVRGEALARAGREARRNYDREHVCPYLYGNPGIFRILRKPAPILYRFPRLRLTIDTQEDYQFACELAAAIGNDIPSDRRLVLKAGKLKSD